MHVLDDPAWSALTGNQASLGVGSDRARRFRTDVAPFASVADRSAAADWEQLAALAGPETTLAVFAEQAPPGWERLGAFECLQYVFEGGALPELPGLEGDARLVELGDADVPEALALVELTRPGPFLPRTIEFGGYRGVRVGDRLAAMAGQRMRPDGYCEVSAVCADPVFQGRGFAARVMIAVMAGILARGERPFLHVETSNERAIAVYERLGFTARTELTVLVGRTPA